MLGEVNGEACRSYTKKRRKKGGARRDLEDLRAAIGHHAAEGFHREIVKVSLPEKGEPRDKWLTRSDAAKLIWTCWRYREMQRKLARPDEGCEGPDSQTSAPTSCSLYFVGDLQRNARGSYRGCISHSGARSLLCRLGARTLLPSETGQCENQQAATDGADPLRLLAHLRRWHRIDPEAKHFVEFNGKPVTSVKTAFKSAVQTRRARSRNIPSHACDTRRRLG